MLGVVRRWLFHARWALCIGACGAVLAHGSPVHAEEPPPTGKPAAPKMVAPHQHATPVVPYPDAATGDAKAVVELIVEADGTVSSAKVVEGVRAVRRCRAEGRADVNPEPRNRRRVVKRGRTNEDATARSSMAIEHRVGCANGVPRRLMGVPTGVPYGSVTPSAKRPCGDPFPR